MEFVAVFVHNGSSRQQAGAGRQAHTLHTHTHTHTHTDTLSHIHTHAHTHNTPSANTRWVWWWGLVYTRPRTRHGGECDECDMHRAGPLRVRAVPLAPVPVGGTGLAWPRGRAFPAASLAGPSLASVLPPARAALIGRAYVPVPAAPFDVGSCVLLVQLLHRLAVPRALPALAVVLPLSPQLLFGRAATSPSRR